MHYKNCEDKKREIIEFLKKNPKATTKELKKEGLDHIDRVFKKGLGEAYREAGLDYPRTLKTRTKEERKKIIINYIQKHPNTGIVEVRKNTKIKIEYIFGSIKEAFEAANIPYPREELINLRKRDRKDKVREILSLIKKNPETTFEDIAQKLKVNPFKMFKNFNEIYQIAGMDYISGTHKRALKKRKAVIEFIKNNPLATQREINKKCDTRIQKLFEKGIFGAYKEAGVSYPFERLNFHGTALKEVKQRAKDFESEIAQRLSCYGNVQRLVKLNKGIADIILERKGEKTIIEVKDYLNKEISSHEIKQLNKYLENCNCNLGFLICHTKPKKDKLLIDKNRIFVLSSDELYKIPDILDKGV